MAEMERLPRIENKSENLGAQHIQAWNLAPATGVTLENLPLVSEP